jgi:hypothetical protein
MSPLANDGDEGSQANPNRKIRALRIKAQPAKRIHFILASNLRETTPILQTVQQTILKIALDKKEIQIRRARFKNLWLSSRFLRSGGWLHKTGVKAIFWKI